MNNPSQEDLLGYVLGALDAQEQRDLQQTIDQNPEIEEELLRIKTSLLPLDALETAGPRVGLARRTCESVASWQKGKSSGDSVLPTDLTSLGPSIQALVSAEADPSDSLTSPVAESNVAKIRPAISQRVFHPRSWSIADVLVGTALVMICAGLLFPVINQTRNHSRVMACQNNLRQVGVAMMNYSSINEGSFVAIPSSGNLAASGCYAPILKDAGLVEDDSVFSCAGVTTNDTPVRIASCDQILAAKSEQEINYYRHTMGGHYGYTMGYCENDKYVAPRSMGRTDVVLLADKPSSDLQGRRSANHNGSGQNCLFEDGRVEFVKGHTFAGDALFENDYGIVAPGSHAWDNVIAPSHLTVQTSVRRAD